MHCAPAALHAGLPQRKHGSRSRASQRGPGRRRHALQHIEQAKLFESLLRADPRFEMVTERSLALLCFQLRPSDTVGPLSGDSLAVANRLTKRLEDVVNQRGIFVVHTDLAGRYVVRFVPGSPWTHEHHIRHAWALFQQAATDVLSEPSS